MPVFCLDPVYYDSTPWEFNLVEVDMGLVREYFGDPGICRMYANDVHKTPCYRLEREPYEFSLFVQLKHSPCKERPRAFSHGKSGTDREERCPRISPDA